MVKIEILKYKNSEDLEIKLKNATTTLCTASKQRLLKAERERRYFKSRKKKVR